MKYFSTKTYGNDRGFSCAFRQPNATHSHCSLIHGYSLGFKFTFESETLDDKNWVVDFGGLKPLKAWLEDNFDHKVVLELEDPKMQYFENIAAAGLCELTIFNGVGVEKFAEHAFNFADKLVKEMTEGRCWCVSAECAEHGANSAIYSR